MSDEIDLQIRAGVATIRLNRPEARNALNGTAMAGLREALTATAEDDAVRVVVLTGTGTVFSAGADLKAAAAGDEGSFAATGPEAMAAMLAQIVDHPKPTIARVQGDVFGGGNGLVAACDLAVAADTARFAFSEVRLGLTPAVISVVCLPKLSRADAMELFLFGERVSAARLVAAGMLNAAVPAAELDAAVDGWVGKLRAGGPLALAGSKELINRVPAMGRDEAFAWTAARSGEYFRSPEAAEGIVAFLQKRPPNWA
jgi:methylglutaconyl-CoA hydratase